MKIPFTMIPQDKIKKYDIAYLIENRFILAKIRKRIYGLPHANQLAYDKLVKHLAI